MLRNQLKVGNVASGDRGLMGDRRGRDREVAREAWFSGLRRGYGKTPECRRGVHATKDARSITIEREHPMRGHDGGEPRGDLLRQGGIALQQDGDAVLDFRNAERCDGEVVLGLRNEPRQDILVRIR
jgi:hypothetical protein